MTRQMAFSVIDTFVADKFQQYIGLNNNTEVKYRNLESLHFKNMPNVFTNKVHNKRKAKLESKNKTEAESDSVDTGLSGTIQINYEDGAIKVDYVPSVP